MKHMSPQALWAILVKLTLDHIGKIGNVRNSILSYLTENQLTVIYTNLGAGKIILKFTVLFNHINLVPNTRYCLLSMSPSI